MRIAIISELMAGGVERVNYLLAKGLNKDGYDTLTISIKGIGKENINDINFVSLGHTSGKKALIDIIKKLKAYVPDWIICCDHTSTVCAIAYRMLFNNSTRVMFIAHSVYSSMFVYSIKSKLILQHYIPKWLKLYNRCDAVIYVSQGVKDDFKKHYKVDSKIEHVIYNPVFENMPEAIHKRNKKASDILKIVTVGRLSKEKNQAMQISALSKLKSNGLKAELYIYGQGDELENLQKLASDLNVKDSVHFMGFSTNIITDIAQYDVFCLSSVFESFGNVLVEAMGAKLPVISVNSPVGPKEILDNGKYGYLIDNDSDALANSIENIITKKYPQEIIEKAYRRAEEFSLEKVIKKYERIITSQEN